MGKKKLKMSKMTPKLMEAMREKLMPMPPPTMTSDEHLEGLFGMASTMGQRRSSPPPDDGVHKPRHYNQGEVECIDAIESATSAMDGIGLTGKEGFLTGQVIKYMWRWKFKDGRRDLEKAKWYLERLLGQVRS